MKKLILTFAILFASHSLVMAQDSYTETFDSNSLSWTECPFKNAIGTAVIERGFLKISSLGEIKLNGQTIREATFYETHCYAPLEVAKPFEVHSQVMVQRITDNNQVGLVFNYRDNGNFYTFAFNDERIAFIRYENCKIVGKIEQGIKWKSKRKATMKWSLTSDGDTLTFSIDDVPLLYVRYMPLTYSGFGYYTFGKQSIEVDEVTFIQK